MSRCSDITLRLWDVATGQCQVVLPVSSDAQHANWIEIIEGIYMAEGCRDGSVAMWKVHVDGRSIAHSYTGGQLQLLLLVGVVLLVLLRDPWNL